MAQEQGFRNFSRVQRAAFAFFSAKPLRTQGRLRSFSCIRAKGRSGQGPRVGPRAESELDPCAQKHVQGRPRPSSRVCATSLRYVRAHDCGSPVGMHSAALAATWVLGCESRGSIWAPGGRSSAPTCVFPFLYIYIYGWTTVQPCIAPLRVSCRVCPWCGHPATPFGSRPMRRDPRGSASRDSMPHHVCNSSLSAGANWSGGPLGW